MIFVVIFLISIYYLFRPIRYKGRVKIKDATEPSFEPNTCGKAEKPVLRGWRLKLFMRLTNTKFGQMFIEPIMLGPQNLEFTKFWKQTCNFTPTFCPVKIPLPSEKLATSDDPILDTCGLRNTFPENGWVPKTVDDYTSAYINKVSNPVVVVKDIIDKIKLVNSEMKIFCDWDEDQIMQQAKESLHRHSTGKILGPFDGVPIVIKDQFDTIGLTVRSGLPVPKHDPCKTDSAMTERIKAQGIIIIGFTNMHQIGVGVTGANPSPLHGITKNPVNPLYHPGASSSGTAAAIAIGLVPWGIGTDGGGSVRIPAAYCNMAAIKPSAGRIPHRGYAGGTNSCVGPMANTMVDCSKLYSIMAGPDFTDESQITWYQPKVEVPKTVAIKSPFSGLKVGVDYGWIKEADDDIQIAFHRKIEEIEKAGAEIVSVQVPDILNMHVAHYVTFTQEVSAQIQQYFEDMDHIGLDVIALLGVGYDSFKAKDYSLALKFRTKLMKNMEQLFNKIDVLATPCTGNGTWKICDEDGEYGLSCATATSKCTAFTKMFNFTGLPAISTPMGYDKNNMPIGLQFASSWWTEKLLMELGNYLEKNLERRKPEYYLPNRFI